MTRPEPPPGALIAGDCVEERGDDPLHAEWLRLGAALAAFDRSVRGVHPGANQDAPLLPRVACARPERVAGETPGAV